MATARIKAPEFPEKTEWLNTEQAVKLQDHRGKVILLDFWSYSNVNCLQSQADIKYLENKYRDGLVVIGIHSPKFQHETSSQSVQKAITRHKIAHPVINDSDYEMWKRFRIKAWPSLIFIDTEGYILGVLSGPGKRQQIDGLIQQNLAQAELKNIRNREPFPVVEHPESIKTLSYPGKMLATEDRLYVSDSGNNRVLECNHEGKILRQFGSHMAGFLDGVLDEASFHNPQGLVKIGDFLYVADSNNHSIRRIHLQNGDVTTVIGNGRPGYVTNMDYADPSIAQLNYPWAMHHHDGSLYITMAGHNQVWRWHLSMNQLAPIVGTGQEGLKDGMNKESMFAQPCGISSNKERLFVMDSSSSALRSIRLPDVKVDTMVGQSLYDYGDQNGLAKLAKLQRPMDLVYDSGRDLIWICDTFNNKLKYLRMGANEVKSLDLQGLDEPTGMCLLGNYLWVANTNRHEITRLDLDKGSAEVIEIHDNSVSASVA